MMPTDTLLWTSTGQPQSSTSYSSLLIRIRSEYQEMPGLVLTEAQAQRLWDLDANTCRALLATLTEHGFLKRTRAGTYSRAAD